MYRHILIPTDGSRLSKKAIVHGVALAQALGAKVTGVFAAPPALPMAYDDFIPVGYPDPDAQARNLERRARRHLGVVEAAAARAGVTCRTVYVANAYPAEAIMATAKKAGCDAICMASHGRRGLAGVLLGSETQKVLTYSKLPVLVCR